MKKCCNCENNATWVYMPGSYLDTYCDNCIPRGCDCNNSYIEDGNPEGLEFKDWKWIDDKKTIWTDIDELGREYPCCEFEPIREDF